MADTWGTNLRLHIFGESHGPAVGIVVDGLEAGHKIDFDALRHEMARRAPGNGPLATARREADELELLSGVHGGVTTGSALCAVIRNLDQRSHDYPPMLRPGHADLAAWLKYGGHADMRGGGHFSGRLTAPIVFAGALCKQLLAKQGICIHGRICSIEDVVDHARPEQNAAQYSQIAAKDFPVYTDELKNGMVQRILDAQVQGDSVGGTLEVAAFGVPGGVGEPFFDSIESVASSLFFSIPAVKGVSFGDGFALAAMRGSTANDPICLKNQQPALQSNHCGGILGGISVGQPIVARLAIKPTPSIARPQASVNPVTLQEETLQIQGRHDPCIVPRALPVAEAMLAIALLELMGGGHP